MTQKVKKPSWKRVGHGLWELKLNGCIARIENCGTVRNDGLYNKTLRVIDKDGYCYNEIEDPFINILKTLGVMYMKKE